METKTDENRIKHTHISARSELEKRSGLDFTCCAEIFKGLQTLNRHQYQQNICENYKLEKKVWEDICDKNKLIKD